MFLRSKSAWSTQSVPGKSGLWRQTVSLKKNKVSTPTPAISMLESNQEAKVTHSHTVNGRYGSCLENKQPNTSWVG